MDTSVEQLSILVSPVSPYLRLSTEGDSGSVDVIFKFLFIYLLLFGRKKNKKSNHN